MKYWSSHLINYLSNISDGTAYSLPMGGYHASGPTLELDPFLAKVNRYLLSLLDYYRVIITIHFLISHLLCLRQSHKNVWKLSAFDLIIYNVRTSSGSKESDTHSFHCNGSQTDPYVKTKTCRLHTESDTASFLKENFCCMFYWQYEIFTNRRCTHVEWEIFNDAWDLAHTVNGFCFVD